MGIDGSGGIVKIETRVLFGQLEVGFEKAANGTDIPPIALDVIAKHPGAALDKVGNDVSAKVIQVFRASTRLEDIHKHIGAEHVNMGFPGHPG